MNCSMSFIYGHTEIVPLGRFPENLEGFFVIGLQNMLGIW